MTDETPKPRRWKLLKDLPWAKAGSISRMAEGGRPYFGDAITSMSFNPQFCEERPDWFEEIKPKRVLVIEVELEDEETGARYVAVARNRLPNRMIYVDRIDQRIEER